MSDTKPNTPPKGDMEKAQQYISQLVDLLNENKISVTHTDLQKFDPNSIQDHYTIILKEYQIEISHSKQPDSGQDSFVMIFNNLKNISAGSTEKIILAYIFLTREQFSKFKIVADHYIERKEKAAEEKRFNEALEPVDQLLNQASQGELNTDLDNKATLATSNKPIQVDTFTDEGEKSSHNVSWKSEESSNNPDNSQQIYQT